MKEFVETSLTYICGGPFKKTIFTYFDRVTRKIPIS